MACALVLLPGLGADSRLFDPQRVAFSNLISPAWLEPGSKESLANYAERMAASLRPMLPSGVPLVLGGVSFGGMVAAQMAPILKPGGLVLIGSAVHPGEIAPTLRLMARAAPWIPQPLGESSRVMGRAFIRQLGPMTREQRHFLETMIAAVPFSFIRWAAQAMMDWPGVRFSAAPMVRIHGDKDRIIPHPAGGIDLTIRGAGHVPSVSHAAEVNRAIGAVCGRV